MKFPKLVKNISEVLWLHWSTKAMAAVVALQGLWLIIPADQQLLLPLWIPVALARTTFTLGILSIFLKLLKQDLPTDKPEVKA